MIHSPSDPASLGRVGRAMDYPSPLPLASPQLGEAVKEGSPWRSIGGAQ